MSDLASMTAVAELRTKQLDRAMHKISDQHKTIAALKRELDSKRAQIAALSAKLDGRKNPNKDRRG